MFKTTLILVMATLCLNHSTKAQDNKAVDVTTTGIQIGQKVPDILIENIHNYNDTDGKPITTAKLSAFKGKLLILDFWATWCSPCIAMIPKMDSLQKQFGDKIQFLSITYQNEKEVLPFLEKYEKQKGKHYNLPVITDEKELHKLFPHIYLPHYVWIDAEGTVKAITSLQEVGKINIEKALTSNIELKKKQDMKIAYDKNKPLFINGNGGDGSNLIYHSVFTSYTEGLNSEYSFTPVYEKTEKRITAKNLGVLSLFKLGYGGGYLYFGDNRLTFKLKNPKILTTELKGNEYFDWQRKGNAYCYEIKVPEWQGDDLFNLMQEDLKRIFPQYNAKIENITTECLVLKSTSPKNTLSTTGEPRQEIYEGRGCKIRNSPLSSLMMRLEVLYMQNSPYPIVNGTGNEKPVDLDIEADLSDLEAVNKELKKYSLKLEVDDWKTHMLVISDSLK